ncbi:MAG: glycosyltransferase [Acidobacteriota bacterium]
MRVAVFTDNDFDKVNGVTSTLQAVLRYASDVEPRIYTAGDLAVETPTYFACGSLGVGLPWYRDMRVYWPRIDAFARALLADHVQVVHITTPGPVGLAARWLAGRLQLPLVGSYHTDVGEHLRIASGSVRLGGAIERYVRWCYGPCDPLLVPSPATRDVLAERGYAAGRLRLWGRGVDGECFAPARASRGLRDEWHVDHRRPAILYAGRLAREKGLDLIGPIQQRLHRHGLAHQFVFAGDGPMRAELQALCPDGLFLGALPSDQMAVVMASSDIFLYPSATDTLGNVVLDAQAAGLPAVVSNEGGPQQHVVPEVTGFVCAARSVDGFAAALVTLVRQTERRVAMGRRAHQLAQSRNWPAALAPLFEAWRDAASRSPIVGRVATAGPQRPALHAQRSR